MARMRNDGLKEIGNLMSDVRGLAEDMQEELKY